MSALKKVINITNKKALSAKQFSKISMERNEEDIEDLEE